MTTYELARAMQDALERKTRDSGAEYVTLKDGSPAWMLDVVRIAHGDMLPDDTRYLMIEAAVDAIAEAEPDGDLDVQVYAMPEPLYYDDTARWLSTYGGARLDYVDQAREEGFVDDDATTWDQIAAGIVYERREVFDLVLSTLRDLADDGE